MQLYKEYENICYQYSINLTKPVINIGEFNSSWGYWDPLSRKLSLSKNLILEYSWEIVVEILKHEMAHQYVGEVLCPSENVSPHGIEFQSACEKLGIEYWARSSACSSLDFPKLGKSESDISQKPIVLKIKKLLALGQSQNEHEALLALKKAKELSDKYNLSDLSSTSSDDYDFITICHNKKRSPSYQVQLASLLTSHFKVEAIFSEIYCQHSRCTYKSLLIYGSSSNLKIAEYIYYYIWNNLPLLWSLCKTSQKSYSHRRSYYSGFLSAIREKLILEENSGLKSHNYSKEQRINLRKKDQQLVNYIQSKHPRTTTKRVAQTGLNKNSFDLGVSDGKKFNLSKGINTPGQSIKLISQGD